MLLCDLERSRHDFEQNASRDLKTSASTHVNDDIHWVDRFLKALLPFGTRLTLCGRSNIDWHGFRVRHPALIEWLEARCGRSTRSPKCIYHSGEAAN